MNVVHVKDDIYLQADPGLGPRVHPGDELLLAAMAQRLGF
jgi:hypothetical protein